VWRGGQGRHRRITGQTDAVAPRPLGRVHGVVRSVDQARAIRGVVRVDGDPDRAGEMGPTADTPDAAGHGQAHPLGQGRRVRASVFRHDGHELFAPPAPQHIDVAQGRPCDDGKLAQGRIPCGVAMAVIEGLEVVEIEDQHGETAPVAPGAVHLPFQDVPQGALVGQRGERIGRGQRGKARVRARERRVAGGERGVRGRGRAAGAPGEDKRRTTHGTRDPTPLHRGQGSPDEAAGQAQQGRGETRRDQAGALTKGDTTSAHTRRDLSPCPTGAGDPAPSVRQHGTVRPSR